MGTESFDANAGGYKSLLTWLESFGDVTTIGVEGTGSYGVGLARFLRRRGVKVVEVNRPIRQSRRNEGKSDTLDAIEAARAPLSGRASGAGKTKDGPIEAIRVLVVAKRSARQARGKAIVQIGHAMAIYGTLKSAQVPKESADEAVAKHFSGARSCWQPTYDLLGAKVTGFSSDVSIQAGKSYISLLRSGKKFGIVQVTAQRFDVGIKLKGVEPTDRFAPAGNWNAMVTHRVRVEAPKQVNAELIRWLRNAYEKA